MPTCVYSGVLQVEHDVELAHVAQPVGHVVHVLVVAFAYVLEPEIHVE